MTETKTIGLGVVRRVQIIGTQHVSYSAWLPVAGSPYGFSTITTIDGQQYGRLGTERLPDALENLPVRSQARSDRVREWQINVYDNAYNMICEAYPALWDTPESAHVMGEITATEQVA